MKKYHHHAKKTALAAMVALALSSTGVFAAAELPVNGEVVAGQVTVGDKTYVPVGEEEQKVYINPATGQTFTVEGNSVIDWSSFDIGSGKALTFVGQGSNYILNRVPWRNSADSASGINGILNTRNIHFILANPNGITVGNGAQLNVINGGSILLAAMGAGFNNANNSITLQNYNYGDRSAINLGGIEAINGNVALMAKTINVADGITFSGDTALKLLAGKTSYNQSITVTPGEGVDSIGSSGSITFNGSLLDGSHKVNLGVSADKITMSADNKITLTGANSAVNINTGSLQNADITGPVVTLVRDGAITVSDSKLTSTVGDVKVLSGTLSEDRKTLSNTVDYSSGSIQKHQITMANSSVISADDAIIAAAAVDISGKKADEDAAIAAENDVFIASGKNVPLQSGILTTETMDTSVTISGAKIKGSSLTLAGNNVRVKNASELTATNDLQIAAAPNITMSDSKAVSGQNNSNYNGNVEITNAALQGKNISLAGRNVTTNGTIGNASTEKVHLLAGQDFNLSADSMGRGLDIKVKGGTISGHDILAEGATVEVANGAAIHAVSAVENEETVAGKVRLLAGSGVTNGVVTATSGNKATVKGTLSGGDIVVAGGAVEVDGGTVNAGAKSAYLLAGNSIKTTAATGSANADGVITSAEGNAVTIKNGATVSANKVHIAGYSADLSSATNNSRITAETEINAVTGSTINNNAGTLVREADAARGRFSRDTASEVTVNGIASSAMIDMPTDGKVVSGSIKYNDGDTYDSSSNYFNLASGDTITANSHSIINWNTFDIGLSGVLTFDTSNGALLNRVKGNYESWLKGTLNHTGTYPLLLVNPQGIHVYKGATINGANLILSGLDMTDTALSNFSTAGAVAYDTASTGDVNLESGITFSNEAEKLALAGRNVTVAQNTIKAESLKADATNTATLTNLAYTGALEGNSVLDSAGGSMTLSGGSYTGNTNLKGTTVNMEVTSHTGDVTVQGTTVGINGGTYTGNMNLAGTSVRVSGVAFDGENKAHNLTLSGLGENGAVTVSNSTVMGARDVALTGKTVNVSQSGNTRADWTAETFTLGKGESASNTTGITNINLTVTKADTTPTVENDVALTLSNTAISAPQINLTPARLTLSGGSSLISDTTVGIAAAGSVDVQGASTVKATAGDLNIGANGALTVQGGSNVTAETGDLNVTAAGALTVKGGSTLEAKTGELTAKGASVAIGVANDTENTIKADAGNITIKAGEDDGRTGANTVNIQNTDLTTNAAGKSITVTGYSVDAAGDLHTKTANMRGNSVNTAGTIAADTVNITGTVSASASGTITAGAVNMSGADSVYASGNITADTLNITGISATGSLTVGGVVNVDNALTLQGGSSGGAVIKGAITAPSITISAQDVTFSGANVTAATGDVSVTGKTIRTYESYYTSSAINSENGDVLLISGTNTAGVYTTTEGGSISADKMNITGSTVTALARTTSIENGTIHADNMQIAAANTVNGSTWEAVFGDTDNPNNLTLTNTTVLSKNGEGAIENVKLAGSNVTFGGGGTDAQAFKANSLAVASDQSITVASGQVNVTGAEGISLSGKSITVDGTIQAKQINLKATENDVTLNSGSALNAMGEDATHAISITANNGNINANGSLTADDSITMNAKTNIATAGTITAATVGMTAENDIGTAGTIKADSVSLAAGNDINSAADITASTITMDGGDGKAISATGALNAAGGTITLGHAPSDESAKAGTKTVTIGPAAGANKAVQAQTVNVHATDTIGLSRVTMETADSLNLASKKVSITDSTVTTGGSLTLNGTEDAANPSVSIMGSILAGTAINATGKGISVGSSDLTATTGGIAVTSTGENDIAVTNTALKAEHATNGNISINSGKAIQATGGSMIAGTDIGLAAIAAKGGEDSDAAYAIKASANMTAGNDIGLTATAGEVYSAGSLTATSGSITMDSADGSKIVATGNMKAENGSITLGHSTGDAAKRTREIEIGPSNTQKIIKAQRLNVNATDSIYMQNVDAEITGASGFDLSSNGITIRGSQIKVNQGDLNLEFSSYASNSDLYSNLVGAILLATDTTEGEGNIAITAHGAIDSRTSTIEAAGNITLDASDGTYINSGYGSMTAHGGNIILQAKNSPTLLGASTSTDAIRVGDKVTAENGEISLSASEGDIHIAYDNSNSKVYGKGLSAVAENGRVVVRSNVTATQGDIVLKGTCEGDEAIKAVATMIASGKIDMEATNGEIRIGATQTANEVTALAKNGDITVSGTVTAPDITLTAGEGNNKEKSIILDDDSNLNASNIVTATAIDGTINANGNITVKDANNNKAGTVTLTAASVSVGDAEDGKTADNRIISAGQLTVNAPEYINVNKSAIDVTSELSFSSRNIYVDNSRIQSAGNINLLSTVGNITLDKVNLTSNSSTSGNGNITITAAKDVNVTEGSMTANKNIDVTAEDGNVTLSANMTSTNGNITLDGKDGSTIDATGILQAENGSVTFGHLPGTEPLSDGTAIVSIGHDVTANELHVYATDSIEVENANITVADTAANGLTLSSKEVAVTDSTIINNGGAVTIASTALDKDVTLTNAVLQAENNTNGKIAISSAKAIEATGGSMTAGKDITLTATDGITVSSGLDAGQDIALMAGTSISASGDMEADQAISLKATGKDISLAGNTLTAGGKIDLLAGSTGDTGWSATENNALGLTNVTLSGAGAVTAKSGKTDIATSNITAGGNVNVTAVGTDSDASHVNVDKSTIAGAGVAISGKGINVDQKDGISENNSTITANTGDVTLTTDTNIAVNNANITAKGKADLVAVDGIDVADTSVTATDKGISITSTVADSDVTLTGVTLNAENATAGNIAVQTGKAISVSGTGSSMTASKDIKLEAKNAGITVSGAALTTTAGNGGNIDLLAGSADGTGWSAIESNALGLTDVTLSAAGAVTAKSGKTDIATSSITAGGNVNVTAVGTDGDASHVNVDKSTIEGAGVAISGKGINVDQKDGISENNSTITANTGDVTLTTDTNIAVNNANITAKGKADLVAANGINVADTGVTATDKGISIESTAADSDVTLTGVTLNAENATAGNIAVQTGKAISVSGTGSSMTAGKDIKLEAKNAGITVSGAALTTTAGNGGNIDLLAGSVDGTGWSAIENNALEVTGATVNAAGAVTGKSGKTDIATSSITAGGNVNMTAVGTDGDASHVNVDKSTIEGAGVAISGKGIKVDKKEGISENTSTITANTGDVALTTDTDIAVNNANITAKGKADLVAATGINVANTSVTATDKGITIISTSDGKDLILTNTTLTATNATNGSITVRAKNAVNTRGSSLTAGDGLTINAENAANELESSTLQGKNVNISGVGITVSKSEGTGAAAPSVTATAGNVALNSTAGIGVSDASITANTGGISVISTDANSDVTLTNAAMTAGAAIEINSGKALNVSEGSMTADNNIGLVAASAVEVGNSKLQGKNVSISGKGITVSDNDAVTPTIKATAGGVTLTSTGDGNDVTLTGATLKADNTTSGNITITSARAIEATGGSMTAGENINLAATASDGTKAVNSSSDMTAGGNVRVASVAGEVVSAGDVKAANITIDSADGAKVSATGSLDAENGMITLGHADGTGSVVIGEAAETAKVVKAANLNIHATDSIATRNANIAVTNDVALASVAISLDGTALTTGGSLDIKGDTIAINASTLRTTNTSNGHINLLAGNADGAAGDGNTLALTNTDVSAAGDVSFRAGQITINADAENAPVKEIRGNNLLLAAAKSYDAENHEYTMESGQTISVTNTNLTGSDSITLLGYKTNVKGDVISKRLLGAVGESVTMNEDGSDVDAYTYTQEEGANVLTVDGAVATSDESDLIYIKLYGDAKFLNKNDTLQTMSFIANSPYSLAISGDMTVTAESGIRLASESIQIQDNLWANNPNASIELASAGGEMNISGNLQAGKDVILKSAQNIVIGTDDKTVSVTADNGSVKLLAGNFDGRYGAQGEWVSANPEVNGIDLNNTAIAAGENIIVKGGAVNFTGINKLAGDASVLAESAVLSGTVSGAESTLTMTADNIVVESGTQLTMHEFATRQGNFTLETAAKITADETDLQGETISLANNSQVVGDAVKVKAENAELAGRIYTDKLTAKADNTLTVRETVKNKAGTDDTIVELEGRNVTFVGSSFKMLTVKGTESITLNEGDLHGEDDIALTTKNLTVATNITTTNGDINLTGTENLRVTGSLTAGQQIGLNGKNIQLSGANLNNGADAQTTVVGENAVITGTITTDRGADLSVKAQNVIVGDSGITNIAVSKFTVEGVEQAKFINTNFQADTTVKGKAAVLTGNIDATGYGLTLQSTNVTIGDGQTATVMTAKSLADADNLTIDQAVLNLDSYKLQAGKAITLKNEVTAEGQALELAAPDASIGDGSANTVIKAGSVSATDKLLVDKAVLAVDDGTLQAQQIILRGNVTADNLDLTLQAPEAAIGDGIVDTVITARSVMGTEDLLIDKASFAVTNPIIATAGNLTLQHEIVAGDTVGFQAGKAITMQGMSMNKSTDVSFEGKLIDMRDSSIDAGKDGKLFFAAYSVKTESPLSYTFQPDNEVIIDNSRLDAGEMTMLGYSIIARNGAEIYADKTLDALAAKKVAMGKLGNLEIVSQATLSTEPQNKLLQQDAIIEVGGRAYHNFRFIPASAYQSDTIMRYLESVNEMPWQIGSDNSPLSIVGIPGLSLYRFQYQDGISDAISGLEMYFTVEPHEGAVREEKEKTNE